MNRTKNALPCLLDTLSVFLWRTLAISALFQWVVKKCRDGARPCRLSEFTLANPHLSSFSSVVQMAHSSFGASKTFFSSLENSIILVKENRLFKISLFLISGALGRFNNSSMYDVS